MGCNCNKRKKLTASASTKTTVELKMPNGDTSEHPTRLAAEAENIRLGGGGKFTTRTA